MPPKPPTSRRAARPRKGGAKEKSRRHPSVLSPSSTSPAHEPGILPREELVSHIMSPVVVAEGSHVELILTQTLLDFAS